MTVLKSGFTPPKSWYDFPTQAGSEHQNESSNTKKCDGQMKLKIQLGDDTWSVGMDAVENRGDINLGYVSLKINQQYAYLPLSMSTSIINEYTTVI